MFAKVIDNCFNLLQTDDDILFILSEKWANWVWQLIKFIETELNLCIVLYTKLILFS